MDGPAQDAMREGCKKFLCGDNPKPGRQVARCKLPEWRCVLETLKPVASTYSLRTRAGDRIFFLVSGTQPKFFRAKTRPEDAGGMPCTEVDAYSS